jgi:hypothetical protein
MTMNRSPHPLIAELAGDLQPVRPIRLGQGMALVALAAPATVVGVDALDVLRGNVLSGHASAFFFIVNGLLGVLGIASALAVLRMASPRVGATQDGAKWSFATLAVMPATVVVMALASGSPAAAVFGLSGLRCFLTATTAGLLTAVALIVWLRRGAPVSLHSAGLFTGVAAGSIGAFCYGLSCPVDTLDHLAIWHVLPVFLSAAVGRLVVPPLIRW